MKNLIIAIILIFAGLNEVQSQSITIKEIAGGTETLYHGFNDHLNSFRYRPPHSIAQPVNEYDVDVDYSPGVPGAQGTVRISNHNDNINNEYVISGEYARVLNVFASDLTIGVGGIYNSNRVEVENAIFPYPETIIQFTNAGWRYRVTLGGTVFSPNGDFDVFYDGPGLYVVSNTPSNPVPFQWEAPSQEAVINWYNCVVAGNGDTTTCQ